MPYDVVTRTAGPVPERFAPAAFASAPASAGKVRLRDGSHARERISVGVAQLLDDRPDGLYGEFRFYNTPEGRAALENVAEGVYAGVSVGFIAEQETVLDGVRVVTRARLHHVSLAEDPAYVDAQLLALRSADAYASARRRPDMSVLDRFTDPHDTPWALRAQEVFKTSTRRV
jgi:HK97 family phage prohead protease